MPKDIDLRTASNPSPVKRQATLAEPDSAIDHARDAYNVASVAKSFMLDNIAPVMSAIAALSEFDSMDVGQNRHRLGLIKRLAKLGCELVSDAATHMESDQDEMQGKLALLEGGSA